MYIIGVCLLFVGGVFYNLYIVIIQIGAHRVNVNPSNGKIIKASNIRSKAVLGTKNTAFRKH